MPRHTDNAGSQRRRQRRIMRSFKIDEISAVDRPAQEGARAVLMKRDDGTQTDEDALEKRAWLTTSTEGHAHLVDEQTFDGRFRDAGDTSWSQSEGEERGHSHPWVRNREGEIVIGEADGHTHEVLETAMTKRTFSSKERERLAAEGKAMPDGGFPIVTRADLSNAIQAFGRAKNKAAVARHIRRRAKALGASDMLPEEGRLAELLKIDVGNGGDDMPDKDENKQALEAAEKRNKELEGQLAEANARAEMTDAQKAYLDSLDKTLDDDKRKEFVAAKADRREAIVKAAREAEEAKKGIAYTAADGTVYTKADDPRLVAMAKRNDELAKQNAEIAKKAEQTDLRKRAESEFANLPGKVEARMALIKAAESIEDKEEREAAMEALKAQNAALGEAFQTSGFTARETPKDGSPEAKLDALAKKHAEEHKVTFAKAYDAVCQTPEGRRLYAEYTGDDKLAARQV